MRRLGYLGVSVVLSVAFAGGCGSEDSGSPGTSGSAGQGGTAASGGAGAGGAGGAVAGHSGSTSAGRAGSNAAGTGAAGESPGGHGGEAGQLGQGGDGGDGCVDATSLPEVIDHDLTVGPGCVRITKSHVRSGATLTLEPGTTALMAPGGYLDVDPSSDGAALVAIGTAAKPVVFTSDAAAPAAGDWQCVRIAGSSTESELRHVRLEYGGAPCDASGAHYEGMLQIDAPARAVTDGAFVHSQSHGVLLQRHSALGAFANNRFSSNAAASIDVSASQLTVLGEGLTFDDAGDRIDVNTTYPLDGTGTVLGQAVPFHFSGAFSIGDHEGEITIGAGARFEFQNTSLEVFAANLIVAGTAERPVVFTSAAEAPAAGDWGCVFFSSPSGTPRFEHLILEYAGSGHGCTGAEYETGLAVPTDAVIEASTFSDIAGSAILTNDDCGAAWCDNSFTGIGQGPLVCNTHDVTPCP